jgi:CheY-like chemotaxis protein
MPSTEIPASARPHPTILVVDDDDYVHGTLAAALRQLKPNLIQARTAADGLALAIAHRPALAIVDLGLPDASGYELTQRLRATPGLETLRIIILTGYEPDPAAAQQAGRPKQSDLLPQNPDARIVRAGTERWLVVNATPEQTWSTVRSFWNDLGFVVAVEQPTIGVMETDWAENRAEIPMDPVRRTLTKFMDILYTTYKRDKFRTRVERGVDSLRGAQTPFLGLDIGTDALVTRLRNFAKLVVGTTDQPNSVATRPQQGGRGDSDGAGRSDNRNLHRKLLKPELQLAASSSRLRSRSAL